MPVKEVIGVGLHELHEVRKLHREEAVFREEHLQALDEEGQGNAAGITVLNPEEIEIEMDGIVQRRKI